MLPLAKEYLDNDRVIVDKLRNVCYNVFLVMGTTEESSHKKDETSETYGLAHF